MKKTLGQYQVTYANGTVQIMDLISHQDFIEIYQKKQDEIYDLNTHPDNRKPKTKEYHAKKVSEIKKELKEMFGDSWFTDKSPLYEAYQTGILKLGANQGPNQNCEVIKVDNL